MKTPLIATVLLCAASFGFGQGTPAAPVESPSPGPGGSPAATVTPYQGLLLTTKVVGSRIKNLQSQDIGTIDDFIFNSRHRSRALCRAGRRWFPGRGRNESRRALGAVGLVKGPPGEAPTYVIDAPKDKLASAPRFDPNKLTDLYRRAAAQPIFDCFGIIFFEDVPAPGQSTAPTGKAVTGTPTPGPTATATPGATGAGLGSASMGNPLATPGSSPSPSPTASPSR